MYFLPWLVSKGLIPYRDFFDHHGFLTYYLLGPFASTGNFEALKLVYITVLAINLTLFLLILKKTASKWGLITGGILYVLINFYVGENILWYESFITTLFLLGYYFILNNHKIYLYLTGASIALATLIKPTAGITILPLLFNKMKKEIFFGWIIILIGAFLFLLNSNSFSQFVIGVINYNTFLSSYFHPSFLIPWKFYFLSAGIIIGSIAILYKEKKHKYIYLSLIFLTGAVFSLKTGLGGDKLILPATFFTILIGQAVSDKKNALSKIFIVIVFFYISILTIKSIGKYDEFKNTRIPWQEELPIKQTEKEIVEKIKPGENLYVFSNHAELYMKLNTLPKTYFPLFFPGFKHYFPDLEKKIIEELKQNKIKYIIIPKQSDKEQLQMKKVLQFVEKEYRIETETDTYKLLKRI